MSLIRISRDRVGALELRGRAWQEDGSLSARYWSEAVKERKEPPGVLLDGRTASEPERARSWTGREKSCWSPSIAGPGTPSLVAAVFWRADPEDMSILDGHVDIGDARSCSQSG